MQAIIVNISDMWPSNIITSSLNSATSPNPNNSVTGTSIPYRPFELDSPFTEMDSMPNPFPSPEPPAPPPAALSPPLQILGLPHSPTSDERASVEPKALAVWSPVGDGGDQGTVGEKSPGAQPIVTQPSAESAATSSAAAAASMTGTPAGLAHWMSVMAEHMNSADGSTAANGQSAASGGTVGVASAPPPPPPPPPSLHHYAWQNGMEAKMSSDQHGLGMQKGLDDRGLEGQQMSGGLYGHRSNSSASSSPPATSQSGQTGLVVPQPINAAKGGGGGGPGHPGGQGASGNNNHTGGHIHSHPSNGSSGRKYQCKMCPQVGKVFGSKADLQLHTQIHMREAKPYKCSQCNKAFANSSYLSQHTRIHLGIKPYKCEICQRKFTQLSHLQQHIRTHTGDKPYKCRHPGCTKAFSQLSNLQSHSRCHQTDKPYKCNSCYKCFVDEQALLEHIPKHKESKHLKTHICQYCGKSYTQETYLAKHMQKHTDRPDKRPSLVAPGLAGNAGAATGNGAAPASGNPSQNQQSQNSAVSSALAAGLAGMPVSQGSQLTAADYHWPKMDPAAAAYAAGVHERDYGLLDPRLNPHAARDMSDPRHHMEDLRAHSQFVGTGNGNVGYDHTGGNAGNIKTSSAFSPIQGSMLHQYSAASQFMGRSGGGFFDPLSYPKHHSQVGFDSKPGGTNSFPNQLISLSQIRNYAHQPDMLHSLKEKVTQ